MWCKLCFLRNNAFYVKKMLTKDKISPPISRDGKDINKNWLDVIKFKN